MRASAGSGVRCWIDHRSGYAYGTDLSDDGLRGIAAGAVEAARIADPDEFTAAPEATAGEAPGIEGLVDPSLASWTTEQKIELAQAVERAARAADERIVGIETTVYADEEERVALASSSGVSGSWEATSAYAYLQAIAEADGDKQTGLGFGMGRSPQALDPEEIGREGGERAASLLGATKPSSRTCPVVLDPMVAASFVGFIGGTLCADAVQRGRSPFAEMLGQEVGSAALTLTDDGIDPAGLNSSPLDAEGSPRGIDLADRVRDPRRLPARLLHRPPPGRWNPDDRQRIALGLSLVSLASPPRTSSSGRGRMSFEELLAEAEGGVFVTDVAGLHSGVNPVSGTFSVGATGRLIEGGALAAAADEFTVASDLTSMLKAIAAAGSEARWVPFGGSVKTPALLIAEMAVGGA